MWSVTLHFKCYQMDMKATIPCQNKSSYCALIDLLNQLMIIFDIGWPQQTFPDEDLAIRAMIQDEAVAGLQCTLGEWVLCCHHGHGHVSTGIWHLGERRSDRGRIVERSETCMWKVLRVYMRCSHYAARPVDLGFSRLFPVFPPCTVWPSSCLRHLLWCHQKILQESRVYLPEPEDAQRRSLLDILLKIKQCFNHSWSLFKSPLCTIKQHNKRQPITDRKSDRVRRLSCSLVVSDLTSIILSLSAPSSHTYTRARPLRSLSRIPLATWVAFSFSKRLLWEPHHW